MILIMKPCCNGRQILTGKSAQEEEENEENSLHDGWIMKRRRIDNSLYSESTHSGVIKIRLR